MPRAIPTPEPRPDLPEAIRAIPRTVEDTTDEREEVLRDLLPPRRAHDSDERPDDPVERRAAMDAWRNEPDMRRLPRWMRQ